MRCRAITSCSAFSRSKSDQVTSLRYLVLFAIAAAPLVVIPVEPAAPALLVVAALLFIVHGLATLLARGLRPTTARDALSAMLLVLWLELSAVVLGMLLFAAIPHTSSNGHPSSGLGALFLGVPAGVVVGAVLAFIALRPTWRDRSLERWLLHIIGTAVTVEAVLACVRG